MRPAITKEWFEKRAALEGDSEIGAGLRDCNCIGSQHGQRDCPCAPADTSSVATSAQRQRRSAHDHTDRRQSQSWLACKGNGREPAHRRGDQLRRNCARWRNPHIPFGSMRSSQTRSKSPTPIERRNAPAVLKWRAGLGPALQISPNKSGRPHPCHSPPQRRSPLSVTSSRGLLMVMRSGNSTRSSISSLALQHFGRDR